MSLQRFLFIFILFQNRHFLDKKKMGLFLLVKKLFFKIFNPKPLRPPQINRREGLVSILKSEDPIRRILL